MALDIHSPMDLVYECFVKLGLRYICVLRDGKYAGMVRLFPMHFLDLKSGTSKLTLRKQTHKKTFVKYMRELEQKHGHM